MIKKIISLVLVSLLLTSCDLFRIHKMDIEQGNMISEAAVKQLHLGMSESAVKQIMGEPILINPYEDNRVIYIYTIQKGYGERHDTRIACIFSQGKLQRIDR